jgi:predicted small lipoprotein YifL
MTATHTMHALGRLFVLCWLLASLFLGSLACGKKGAPVAPPPSPKTTAPAQQDQREAPNRPSQEPRLSNESR